MLILAIALDDDVVADARGAGGASRWPQSDILAVIETAKARRLPRPEDLIAFVERETARTA